MILMRIPRWKLTAVLLPMAVSVVLLVIGQAHAEDHPVVFRPSVWKLIPESKSENEEEKQGGSAAPEEADIKDPGPDTADFPDSAFTVPPGAAYLETSLTYASAKGPVLRDYFTATLIRVGLIQNLELRISTPGLIVENTQATTATGFGPFTIGFKAHVWDEIEESGIPALGIIGQLTTRTGSAGFNPATVEPFLFFNFDHTLPSNMEFEWNAGIGVVEADDGDVQATGVFLWALSKEFTPKLTGFIQGFTIVPTAAVEGESFDPVAGAVLPAVGSNQPEVVIGPGFILFASRHMALDASYNFGLTPVSPHRILRFGVAMAF